MYIGLMQRAKSLSVVVDDLNMPNGLAFSKDETILYIADSGAIQAGDTYYPWVKHEIFMHM